MVFPLFSKMNHRQGSGRVVMLSDLHLWGPEDPLYRALIRFLEATLKPGDTFIIVGDLFDIFIGNKAVFGEKFKDLLTLMKDLGRSGVKIFYLEGNHDFLLKDVFHGEKNIEIFTDEIIYEWNGRPIFICHGDRINPQDYGYRVFRFAIRNAVSKCLIDTIPGALLDKMGRIFSATSRKYNPETSEETVRLFRNFACEKISKGYDFVVMGHSHFVDDLRFTVENHEGQYVNNGFPRRDCRFLELKPGDQFISLQSWEDYILPLRPQLPPPDMGV